MSWDADLYADACPTRGHGGSINSWNFTHNTNRMISEALRIQEGEPAPPCSGPLGAAIGPAWWDRLDGATGADGATYLNTIIAGLRSQPHRLRLMNPENGWGNYDSMLAVLEEMAEASAAHPAAAWTASG